MPYFGVPIRNGLPIGLGTLTALAQAVAVVVPPVSSDPYFEYVSLLTNTTSTNGAQNNTFLDSSTNAFSVTRNGNTTQGNFSPFSQTGWSNFFDGTGDYLSLADNAALNMGSSDFTIESWIYTNSGVVGAIVDKDGASAVSWSQYLLYITPGGKFEAIISTTTTSSPPGSPSARLTGTTTVQVGTWYHVAVTRVGTNATLWVNGVSEATSSTVPATLNTRNQPTTVGTSNNAGAGASFLNGYLSNTRIVKGTAVYTSNFTPSTSPLTAITNTSLLTCQSNRFIDNSSNAFAITRNGDVSVQAFSPFNPTAAWSASTNGGSGYFDGTGDNLSAASNAAFNILSGGDFTVECWFYANSLPSNTGFGSVLISRDNTGSTAGFIFRVLPTALEWVYPGLAAASQAFTFVTNTWYHVAAVRSSGAFRLYINGTQYSPTYTDRTTDSATALLTGASAYTVNTAPFTGYISNARIVKGTAVYTANFTPPTAPLTAITNTSLLLNFTNAGIYDSASGNDLETVGNAQVSTTQAKWGTTSMAFDGTGDWLTVPDSPTQRFGTGDFTVEFWMYVTGGLPPAGIIGKGTSTTGWEISWQTGRTLRFTFGSTSATSVATFNNNTWYHVALVRSGSAVGNVKLYLDGTAILTSGTAVTDNLNQTNVMYVGANRTGANAFTGYIDDLRITNGYARYTANFTPPTAAFPLN